MDSFQIIDNLHSMNWNELTSIINEAKKIRSDMENQAIGVMENAQSIMKENNTHQFPQTEHDELYMLLGFTGGYKQANEVMDSFVRRKKIKYAVAAFCESATSMPTLELKSILGKLYGCNNEYIDSDYQKAKTTFWQGFDKRKNI